MVQANLATFFHSCMSSAVSSSFTIYVPVGFCEFRQATVKRGWHYCVASKSCWGTAIYWHHTYHVFEEVTLPQWPQLEDSLWLPFQEPQWSVTVACACALKDWRLVGRTLTSSLNDSLVSSWSPASSLVETSNWCMISFGILKTEDAFGCVLQIWNGAVLVYPLCVRSWNAVCEGGSRLNGTWRISCLTDDLTCGNTVHALLCFSSKQG